MQICKCTLSVHDFFFYASRAFEVNVTAPFINNTALLYALNNHTPSLQRLFVDTKPHYKEDRPKFELYATPAALLQKDTTTIAKETFTWKKGGEKVKVTYNAVHSPLLFKMKRKTVAFPKTGAYSKYLPLTTFQFFTIGGKGDSVIRIGKKMSSARVLYTPLEETTEHTGKFQPDHPVNPVDLPEATTILEGSIHNLPPSPLVTDATLKGRYYKGKGKHRTWTIAAPDSKKYKGVAL